MKTLFVHFSSIHSLKIEDKYIFTIILSQIYLNKELAHVKQNSQKKKSKDKLSIII